VTDATQLATLLGGGAGVAGVRALLYGSGARRVLREQLAALLEPGAAVGRCRLDRAKFKPGRKLTGYYLIEVLHRAGRDVRAVEVTWHAAGQAETPDEREPAMEEEARAAGVAAPFRYLRGHVPSTGAVLRVAPLDVAYPQLVRLCRPDYVQGMLAAAYQRAGEPDSAAAAYRVTTVRYRPRQRHVLRYDPPAGWPAGPLYAKLYRDGAAARAMRVAGTVADFVASGDARVTAARPLAGTAPDGVLLYPRVSGVPLSQRLRDGGQARHLTAAGAVLRALHRDPGGLAADLHRRDLAAELASVARAAEHLEPLLPAAAARLDRLLRRAGELGTELPGGPPCFAHGDYKADHVWVTRDRLTLLDFDTCCLAEPALDVGKFLADVTWWYAVRGRGGGAAAQRLFLAGYGAVPAEELARARLYEAVVLSKLTIRRLRRFAPDWGRRTEELLDLAGRLLDAVETGKPAVTS